MEALQVVFWFIVHHYDLFLIVFGAIVPIVKLTAWGKANAHALQVVTGVIEAVSARAPVSGLSGSPVAVSGQDIKQSVAAEERKLPPAVVDALRDAVAVVDPNKTAATPMQLFVRELLRMPGKSAQ